MGCMQLQLCFKYTDAVRRNKEDLAKRSQEFQHSTVSHIVDIPAFQEQFEDICKYDHCSIPVDLNQFSLVVC